MMNKFQEYLETSQLQDNIDVTRFGNLQFHWSNCDETVKYRFDHLENSEFGRHLYQNLVADIIKLKTEDVTLYDGEEVVTLSQYELFQYMTYKRDKCEMNLNRPWVEFTTSIDKNKKLSELYHSAKFNSFVYYELFNRDLGARNFRINSHASLLLQLDTSPKRVISLRLKQISHYGLLVHSTDLLFQQQLYDSKTLKLFIDSEFFKALAYEDYQMSDLMEERMPKSVLYGTDVKDKFEINVDQLFLSNPYFNGHDLFIPYRILDGAEDYPKAMFDFSERMKKEIIKSI